MKPSKTQGGFALVAAVFLLVAIAAMGAFAVTLSANASATGAIAVQSARAYEAARAGVHWAAHQIRDPHGTLAPGATNLPDCFASPKTLVLPAPMGSFSVAVTCARYPAVTASPNFHEEGSQRVVVYSITSTASAGTPGAADYVERRLEAKIEKCKDADADAPGYACF